MISFEELKKPVNITVGALISIGVLMWIGFGEYNRIQGMQKDIDDLAKELITVSERMDKRNTRTNEKFEDHELRIRKLETNHDDE